MVISKFCIAVFDRLYDYGLELLSSDVDVPFGCESHIEKAVLGNGIYCPNVMMEIQIYKRRRKME